MKEQVIKVQSPTRVDLSGGTLDCWPLYLLVGNCETVNLSISIFTGVELTPKNQDEIELEISDLGYRKVFASRRDLLRCDEKQLTLIKPHIEYWDVGQGFRLKTWSQSPVGGGLGGSSSLCISILKAFSAWQKQKLSVSEMVLLSSNIEAKILRTPTGTQDYFPAARPGLSVIEYSVEGPRQKLLDVNLDSMQKKLLLVYTGKAHHSGINNWEVLQKSISGDRHTLECLKEIAQISKEVARECEGQNWGSLPELFRREYKARTALCASFVSPEIEQLNELALQAGAEAVKICGAGGGGCVLVWCDENKRDGVVQACEKNGFQVLPAHPVK
ncbi:MAG: galactokinase [Bdellovibrionales bacterium]|nr:galactokinase [Bdellovibrionales bacterium]